MADAGPRPDRPPTDLAYLEDAYRKTLLTEVAAVAGQAVALPRTLYYAPSSRYGHAQPTDRGHFLVGGHKLKLERVQWRERALAHVVRGPPPRSGEKLLAHLDWERRHLLMRTHAAMHLLSHAVVAERRGEFLKEPEVLNGGHLRATLKLATRGPKGVADVLARVNQLASGNLPQRAAWVPRDVAARRATPQHVDLGEVAPGEPVLRVVETGDAVRVPCDAPTLRDTREIGRVVAPDVLERPQGTRVVFRVVEAA